MQLANSFDRGADRHPIDLTNTSLTNSSAQRVIELLFPKVDPVKSILEIQERYPKRDLPEGVLVTRVAPSPTGYMHIGGIYMALINFLLARQSNGVFMLRIEDTDQKRLVEGADQTIMKSLARFNFMPDEGPNNDALLARSYGPYVQCKRLEIYRAFAVNLILSGRAYPCFTSADELEKIKALQKERHENHGYYGNWATWRDASYDKIQDAFKAGQSYVLRLKSFGNPNNTVTWQDGIKKQISMQENYHDIVLLKSDGIPTYHFAHVVDDYLMGTTDVIRGDEWLSSVPIHLELFAAMGWPVPRYAHCPPIQKIETLLRTDPATGLQSESQSRRKLSKRSDPEANVEFYFENGYPTEAIIEYLLNLANSTFEVWRRANPDRDYLTFPLSLSNFSASGALSDMIKVGSISQEVLNRMSLADITEQALTWTQNYDAELFAAMSNDMAYLGTVLNVGRVGPKPAKRLKTWKDLRPQLAPFFDDLFEKQEFGISTAKLDLEDSKVVLQELRGKLFAEASQQMSFEKLKGIALELGMAASAAEYKANPTGYKGQVGDLAALLRAALWKSPNSPDISEVVNVLGRDRVIFRLNAYLNWLNDVEGRSFK